MSSSMFRSYRDTVRTPKAIEIAVPDIYDCNMCSKGGWNTENDVEVHKKETHYHEMHEVKVNHRNRFCSICMTLQDSRKDLIEHIKSQHLLSSPQAKRVERKIYICNECTHIFFNKDVLATHMLYTHIANKKDRKHKNFTCPKCSKICSLKSVWFHLQKHDVPSVSMCDICLDNFTCRAALNEHIKTHKAYYKCEPCGYTSTQREPFNKHLLNHTEKPIPHGTISSEVIKSVFKRHKDNLTRYNVHNSLKGINLPRFFNICTLCREICLTNSEMKQHVLRDHTHERIEKKRYVCACGEEFQYQVVLKQHVMKMNGSHRPVEKPPSGPETKTELKVTSSIQGHLSPVLDNNVEEVNKCEDENRDVENNDIVSNIHNNDTISNIQNNDTISNIQNNETDSKLQDFAVLYAKNIDKTDTILLNDDSNTSAELDNVEITKRIIVPMETDNENNDKHSDTENMPMAVCVANNSERNTNI